MKTTWVVLAVVVLLVAATVCGTLLLNRYRAQWRTAPDLSEVGGTLLLYDLQLDPDARHPVPPASAQEVAEALQRRFAASESWYALATYIRPNQVQVIVPRMGGDHAADVAAVKELVRHTGLLEFRVLANGHDDGPALEAAAKFLAASRADPARREALGQIAEQGLPPPAPGAAFPTPLGTFTYSWVEAGRDQCRELHLDNAAEKDEAVNRLWKVAAAARAKGEAVAVPDLDGALLFSRECRDRNLTEKKRGEKRIEYFLLCRDPEKAAGGGSKAVTGRDLESAYATVDAAGGPAVGFRLNQRAGDLFRELTEKNRPVKRPDGLEFRRRLAILLDRRIMSAPFLQGPIGPDGVIEGRFTPAEVDRLVSILRAGALPGALKPVPVREAPVRGTKE
jgi:hypothetical protein